MFAASKTAGASTGTGAGSQIGTARVRFMEWHDIQPFGYSSIYKLGLFDIQMNAGYDFARDVKSLYSATSLGSTDSNLAFSADISNDLAFETIYTYGMLNPILVQKLLNEKKNKNRIFQ